MQLTAGILSSASPCFSIIHVSSLPSLYWSHVQLHHDYLFLFICSTQSNRVVFLSIRHHSALEPLFLCVISWFLLFVFRTPISAHCYEFHALQPHPREKLIISPTGHFNKNTWKCVKSYKYCIFKQPIILEMLVSAFFLSAELNIFSGSNRYYHNFLHSDIQCEPGAFALYDR